MPKVLAFLQTLKTKLTPWFNKFLAFIVPLLRRLFSYVKSHKKELIKVSVCLLVIVFLIKLFGHYLLPPKVSYTYPEKGGIEIPLDTNIEIVFNRDVNTKQAEESFQISPKVDGQFTWSGQNRLIFTPSEKFQRNQIYTVSFPKTILSRFFIPMFQKPTYSFTSLGQPKVVLYSPKFELPSDFAPVTVVFDRPMIPLTAATNSAEKLPPFTIIPDIKGSGRWLGTTSYQFNPEVRYKRATTYEIKFVDSLQSADGGVLPDDYNWSFSSVRPKVEKVSPENGYKFASPTASVSAVFSQNILLSSLNNRFQVFTDQNKEVTGKIIVNGRIVGFYPDKPLVREKTYKAVIKTGVQSPEGPNGLESDYSWYFTTAPKPEIISTYPIDGNVEKEYNDYNQNNITIDFKSPMSEDSMSGITVFPSPETKYTPYLYNNDLKVSLYVWLRAKTTYTVTVPSSVKDQYGVSLGKPYVFKFTTGVQPPSISVFPNQTYFAAFNQAVTPRVIARVYGTNKVDYSLHRLDKDAFLDLYRKRYTGSCGQDYECTRWQNYDFAKNPQVRSWSETLTEIPPSYYHMVTKVTNADGTDLSPGFYYLDLRISDSQHEGLVLIVTKTVLTLKSSTDQLLVWAVDQSTGEVVSNLDLEVVNELGNSYLKGKTDQNGVWIADYQRPVSSGMFVFGQKDGDLTVVNENWQNGINRYDFGLPSYYAGYRYSGSDKMPHQLFVYPDRPIYRPGQTIYFQGLVRKDSDGAFSQVSSDSQVSVTISDSRNRNLYSQKLTINSFGSFNGQVNLSADANLGEYQITVDFLDNSFTQPFQVEEYKKPEVSVSVSLSQDQYVQGDLLDATINAAYYFGSPVANAPVTWTLQTQDQSFSWSKNWRYEFGNPDDYWSMPWWDYGGSYYYSGKIITSGKGITDADGKLKVRLPLDISKFTASQKMVLEAVVNDISNQSIAASNTFSVYKGGLYAGLSPDHYGGNSKEEQKISLVTVNVNGQEVANQSVKIKISKRDWNTIRVEDPETGNFVYKNNMTDDLKYETVLQTNDQGYGSVSFTPDTGGTFIVRATVTDSSGRTNTSGTYLWISGPEYSTPRENNDRIRLIPDKSQYQVGDKASLFIDTPYATASAKTLLTMERGRVLDYKVVDTSDTSNNFTFDIKDQYSPNLYLSAMLIKSGKELTQPAEFKMGLTQISVVNPEKHLNIKITPDKDRYQPGSPIKISLDVTDDRSRPVSAEISLGVVDQAVWDLSTVNLADIHSVFYQPRVLGVNTSQLLTISLDRVNANTDLGSKGGGGGEGGFDTSRKNFPDTAFWNPSIVTNANGHAEISFTLPDNLTTWRIVAVGNSTASAFGSNYAQTLVTRDVLVRPFLPRFLSVSDQAILGTIVSNTTSQSQLVTAKISTRGLKIQDALTQTQAIAANSSAKFTWNTITSATDSAQILLSLNTQSGYSDSAAYTLPVVTYYTPEVVSTSGMADSTAVENIKLPPDTVPDMGGVTLDLSNNLGNLNTDILDYLISYPYYCAEQSSSKLLPFVYYHSVLGLRPELNLQINSLVQRLVNMQKPEGGWGWWGEGESQPYLSAIVYQALSYQASHAGKDTSPVDKSVLTKAETYLTNVLTQSGGKIGYNAQAFIIYVLKDSPVGISSFAANLYSHPENLSLAGKAQLAMASQKLYGFQNRFQKLLAEIESLTFKTATTTHWEERNNYYYFGSDLTTTATVLELLLSVNPKHPYVASTLRYLNSARIDGHFATTRENAAVIIALSSQAKNSSTSKLDTNYRLTLSGNKLAEGKLTNQSLSQKLFYPLSQFNIGSDNSLEIAKSGSGKLYYNLDLKYYLPYAEREAFDQGIVIIRDFVDASGKILDSQKIRENSEVYVRLTIVTPALRNYVVIEDFLPAGLEAINANLKNVSSDPNKKTGDDYWETSWYFNHTEYHDDRVTTFAEYLPAGLYEFTYRVRATIPGKYHFPAAQAYEMYVPDISGHSASGFLTITPK